MQSNKPTLNPIPIPSPIPIPRLDPIYLSQVLRMQSNKCPICRTSIESLLQVSK